MSEEDEHWMGQYSAESQIIAILVTLAIICAITAGIGYALYSLVTL